MGIKMVVISIKRQDGDGFLFEATTSTRNDDLITRLVRINNERLRARVIVEAARGLASFGPMKQPDKAGVDKISDLGVDGSVDVDYSPDPNGLRTGIRPSPQLA